MLIYDMIMMDVDDGNDDYGDYDVIVMFSYFVVD
jgi:hypothetical protein